MTPQQIELYKKIDEILWEEWDPIGINDEPTIRNEYEAYIPHIFSMKIQGPDKKAIAEHLYKLETINIGVTGSKEHCNDIAQKIIDLKL